MVASNDSEPRLSMSRAADFGLGFAKKHLRHTGSAGRPVQVDLFQLIALHDNESDRLAVRLGYPRSVHAIPRSGYELRLVAMADELGRNISNMTVGPPGLPDAGYRVDVARSCLAD